MTQIRDGSNAYSMDVLGSVYVHAEDAANVHSSDPHTTDAVHLHAIDTVDVHTRA